MSTSASSSSTPRSVSWGTSSTDTLSTGSPRWGAKVRNTILKVCNPLPPKILFLLEEIGANHVLAISPDGALITRVLAKAKLLTDVLKAIDSLSAERSAIKNNSKRRFREWGLKIIMQPDTLAEARKDPDLKTTIKRIIASASLVDPLKMQAAAAKSALKIELSTCEKKLLKEGLSLVEFKEENTEASTKKFLRTAVDHLKAKNGFDDKRRTTLLNISLQMLIASPSLNFINGKTEVIDPLIKLGENSYDSSCKTLAEFAKNAIEIPLIPFRGLLFLLTVLNGEAKKGHQMADLCAGIRLWDPEASTFLFSTYRMTQLAIKRPLNEAVFNPWMEFLQTWYATPANQDLTKRREVADGWNYLNSTHNGTSVMPFLPIEASPSLKDEEIEIMELPKKFWENKKCSQQLYDSILHYYVRPWFEATTAEIFLPQDKKFAILPLLTFRGNQISAFIIRQLLQPKGSCKKAVTITEAVCTVIEKCLDKDIFSVAQFLISTINQRSITPLHPALRESHKFKQLFEGDNLFVKFPSTFKEKLEERPSAVESPGNVERALSSLNDIKDADLTDQGFPNLDILEGFGKLYNNTIARKNRASEAHLIEGISPLPSLINQFESQFGDFNNAKIIAEFDRMLEEIHPHRSDLYWDKKIKKVK